MGKVGLQHIAGRTLSGLGIVALVVFVALAAFGALVVFQIAHVVAHGDDETRLKAAAEALACPSDEITVEGSRAKGCGKECTLETYGSSATWFSSYVCRR